MMMLNKKNSTLLLLGDYFIFALSLLIALVIRGTDVSIWNSFKEHLVAFVFIFFAWSIVFFIAGLYDLQTKILKDKLPSLILNTQFINSGIAVLFFYLVPYFGIAPKTILFLDLLITFILVYVWRINSNIILGSQKKEPAILIGSGEEMRDIFREVNENPKSELNFVMNVDLDKENDFSYIQNLLHKIKYEGVSVMVIDLSDKRIEPILPTLYRQIFSNIKFVGIDNVYENLFNRIPLSFLQYEWFLQNISATHDVFYSLIKRLADIFSAVIIGVIFLVVLPFVVILIKIEDGGSIFYKNKRIGRNNGIIEILKFRSMSEKEKEKITKIGMFLRKTRVDELPQFLCLLLGDISLIGPRPETPELVKVYEEEIPYYNIRHIIKPGLSGWAQIYQENPPKYGVDFNNTKDKLSYDLYYLKNKSIMLDINIGLKTVKELISRRGK